MQPLARLALHFVPRMTQKSGDENERMRSIEKLLVSINERMSAMETKIDEMKGTVDRMDELANPTPLWKVVSELPDVFEKEILTKLNEIELKVFYGLCKESRDVVLRSKIKLNNEKRNVFEIKSMQELELAWVHYRFGEVDRDGLEMTQEAFCVQVAETNNLDYLKWAREVKQCACDEGPITVAARLGNLEMVKYCVENDCPINIKMCPYPCWQAARFGHLDILKYLHENDCAWNTDTFYWALENNHNDCFEYAFEQKCPGWERYEEEEEEEEGEGEEGEGEEGGGEEVEILP